MARSRSVLGGDAGAGYRRIAWIGRVVGAEKSRRLQQIHLRRLEFGQGIERFERVIRRALLKKPKRRETP